LTFRNVANNASIYNSMPAILYTCPVPSDRVSGWVADDPESDDERFGAVDCIACRRTHSINPKTGKTLNAENKSD